MTFSNFRSLDTKHLQGEDTCDEQRSEQLLHHHTQHRRCDVISNHSIDIASLCSRSFIRSQRFEGARVLGIFCTMNFSEFFFLFTG